MLLKNTCLDIIIFVIPRKHAAKVRIGCGSVWTWNWRRFSWHSVNVKKRSESPTLMKRGSDNLLALPEPKTFRLLFFGSPWQHLSGEPKSFVLWIYRLTIGSPWIKPSRLFFVESVVCEPPVKGRCSQCTNPVRLQSRKGPRQWRISTLVSQSTQKFGRNR